MSFQSKIKNHLSFFGKTSEEINDNLRGFTSATSSVDERKGMLLSFLQSQNDLADCKDEIEVCDFTFTSGVVALEISNKKEVSLFANGIADFVYGKEAPLVDVLVGEMIIAPMATDAA